MTRSLVSIAIAFGLTWPLGGSLAPAGDDYAPDPGDAGRSFVDRVLAELGATATACPADWPGAVAADQTAACAAVGDVDPDYRKTVDRAVRGVGRGVWEAVPSSRWRESDGVRRRSYALNYVPIDVVLDAGSGRLAIVRHRVGPCADGVLPPPRLAVRDECVIDAPASSGDSASCPSITDRRARPAFPEQLRLQHRNARLDFWIEVDAEGAYAGMCVASTTYPLPELVVATAEAARQWRYEAASFDGRSVRAWFKAWNTWTIH